MIKKLGIIGCGGMGRKAVQLVKDINLIEPEWELIGFFDDDHATWGKTFEGVKVLGSIGDLNQIAEEFYCVCTISVPKIKRKVLSKIKNSNIRFARLIHPTAIIAESASLGEDVIIEAFCFVSVGTCLGNHVQLNCYCGIGHDAYVGDYSSLYWAVNLSGYSKVEEDCILGTKTTVIQNVVVGKGAIIGSNSNVIRDIPPNCTAVGNPAKPIKF